MSDLIDRQAAIRIIKNAKYPKIDIRTDFDLGRNAGLEFASVIVDGLPPIQPEIVRCGECKWFQCNMSPDGYLPQGVDEFECRHWCGSCDPTDFCSYAERRTNG